MADVISEVQLLALEAIYEGEPLTTNEIQRQSGRRVTYTTMSILRRAGFVNRVQYDEYAPYRWEITTAGRIVARPLVNHEAEHAAREAANG